MARPHIKITIETIDYSAAELIKTWLEGKIKLIELNKLAKWDLDGIVQIDDGLIQEKQNNPKVIFFANVNANAERIKLLNYLKDKIKDDKLSKLVSIKVETWDCSHDEDNPKPCKPNIIYEKVF